MPEPSQAERAKVARRGLGALALAALIAGCSGQAEPVGPAPPPYAAPPASPYGYPAAASPYGSPPVASPYGSPAAAPYGSMCYAGPYVCRMQSAAPLGSSCTCPGLGAPSYGQVRGG